MPLNPKKVSQKQDSTIKATPNRRRRSTKTPERMPRKPTMTGTRMYKFRRP